MTAQPVDYIPTLEDFVSQELLGGEDVGLDVETPLVDWGVIDSFKLVVLITYISDTFHIEVPDAERHPDNFQNLTTIAGLLARLDGRSHGLDR
jgi:acyl carrier protein